MDKYYLLFKIPFLQETEHSEFQTEIDMVAQGADQAAAPVGLPIASGMGRPVRDLAAGSDKNMTAMPGNRYGLWR
ncbi:hypothetical protein [Effusibacillus lacus]|uniref:hypothetical protein n=1 Tax=Effusibacillus lacus TaxID=1348429 RepID=UPI000BB81E83|nr:hypothetical protein [Effusibacillus lacus]TCS76974.1 hypothetical protein EDD64_101198 [Effusibacillus lacus]